MSHATDARRHANARRNARALRATRTTITARALDTAAANHAEYGARHAIAAGRAAK
jgi:hypothetical protein